MSRIAVRLALVVVLAAPSLPGADGLDPAYGRNGVALPELTLADGTWASFVSVDSSGRVLLTGAGENNPGGALACLLPDGRLDTSFGDFGVSDLADGLRAQRARFGSSDRIVVSYKDRVVLLDRNGIPDWSFGIRKDGVALIPGSGELLDAQEGPHGSIVGLLATRVCGPTGGGCRVVGVPPGPPSLALSARGEVLLAGSPLEADRKLGTCVRFGPDGSLDPGFGEAGIFSIDTAPGYRGRAVTEVVVAPDGRILVAGSVLACDRRVAAAVGLSRRARWVVRRFRRRDRRSPALAPVPLLQGVDLPCRRRWRLPHPYACRGRRADPDHPHQT